jgi:hypothetical protein
MLSHNSDLPDSSSGQRFFIPTFYPVRNPTKAALAPSLPAGVRDNPSGTTKELSNTD